MTTKIEKSEAEWRAELSPEQYHILREKGTERAFTGAYWDEHTPGVYRCAACGNELFRSDTKFESGTGWPSFYQPADPSAVETETDRSFFMTRTEANCARCGSHLGHIFDDGPNPTGLRYCINSASLKLDPSGEPQSPAGADGVRLAVTGAVLALASGTGTARTAALHRLSERLPSASRSESRTPLPPASRAMTSPSCRERRVG